MSYFRQLKNPKDIESPENRRGRSARRLAMRDIIPPEEQGTRQASQEPSPKPAPIATAPVAAASPAPTLPIPTAPAPKAREMPGAPRPSAPEKIEAPPQHANIGEDLPVLKWEPVRVKRYHLKKYALLILLLALIAGFSLVTFAFSRVTVTIHPKINTLQFPKIELTGSTTSSAVDSTARTIPSLEIAVEKTAGREFKASGRKVVHEKARGKVIVFNTLTLTPQTLVRETRLQDPQGRIFRLVDAATIPAATRSAGKILPSSIEVTVVANSPGKDFNIGPSEFRIPGFRGSAKYDSFYGKSEQAFSGGFDGDATVVTASDLTFASEELTRDIVAELEKELRKKIPIGDDFVVPNGAKEVVITAVEQPREGEAHEQFSVKVSAKGHLFAVRKSDIAAFLLAQFGPKNDELPVKVPVVQDGLIIAEAKVGSSTPEIRFAATGTLRYYRQPPVEDFITTLKGASPDKVETYLGGRDEIESFVMKRFPRWLWFIPEDAKRFSITIEPSA